MHFTQLLPCIIASASVAVAQLIPVGPIATFYTEPDYQGNSFIALRVDKCLQLPQGIVGNVSSVQLQQFPSPYYVSCTLYNEDNCHNPAASAIYYAISIFDNNYLPDHNVRSVSCALTRLFP
ncbi:hypothetical protein MKX07_001848 [Trichoderma sp. CBMAI-0711]|uniref:Predicted protein n=3 Tax=Trichoderma TaxID=5543 RepID=G0RM69_HYPJQ|nr:uncharacterized protein TRIREDRAFT_122375 [Trichoderma reesei QM6a]EGR47609.1 predicted protein [Trichoderma reesei QM6a]ETS01299.1 hypothetical protein M419DRAFT_111905 [Trichoderma reesei RUT C-30]KAK1253771.1 hypothetical protein MKX07_001848 [Trichoderma sp. CBMAI-0711]OTA03488.1 MRSP1/expansin-like protein [Trichoderma parareesei]